MARSVELLLVENVESLGIVGDVVKVRTGYARNFLLPRELATTPSDDKIKDLAGKRAEAERQVAALRSQREQMTDKLQGVELSMERSCNDQGLLYGSVTQQEIATALNALGFSVRPRDVRLNQAIKRVDTYDVHIKPDVDLEAVVKLKVLADRPLEQARGEPEAPAKGVEAAPEVVEVEETPAAAAPEPAPAKGGKAKGEAHTDKPAKPKGEAPAEKSASKGDKAKTSSKGKGGASDAPEAPKAGKTGWGFVSAEPTDLKPARRERPDKAKK